jgi:hypothetical protein
MQQNNPLTQVARMTDAEKKPKVRYDRALLDEVLKRDGATLVGEYEKLNRDSKIKFICGCAVEISKPKVFRSLYEHGGAFCETCLTKNSKIKLEKSITENKYGACPGSSRSTAPGFLRPGYRAQDIGYFGTNEI